jgi:hypothetical protein
MLGALGALAGASVLLCSPAARAQAAPPASHHDEAFDIMNVLAHHGLHDIDDETWNAYGQFTYISSWKLPFHAPYTNKNGSTASLIPDAERSFTASATLFVGLRLWQGGEAYFVPEVIAERALSGLHGLGGSIQNFELQKTGGETPQLYRSRTFLRQNIGFGGEHVVKTSDPMQLGAVVDGRRLVITAGNFTVLDVFDHNSITWDPRQTFFNMAFMTHSSWDFPADARGYAWGGAVELYWDDWAFRIARVTPPENPNSLPVDFRLDKHYGDEVEIEHDHKLFGMSGAVRLLAYQNRVVTGRFDEAIAAFKNDATKNAAACTTYNYGSTNATAPDLCWVRRPNAKVGLGINVEQHVVNEDMGVFARAMYSDGQSEVDAFNPADRSVSFGASAKGSAWGRHFDVAGIGYGLAWISQVHADYLALGGVDGFVGDGALRQAAETVFEVFYSVNVAKALWFSGDYQHITSPGFNADRGPVNVFGARAHAEF